MRRRTKRIALITGASSGLGAEFARQIDQSEERIDEIWLLARREDRLREVAQSLKKACRLVPMDLTKEENLDALEMMLAADQVRIGLLINCAGFGKIGSYASVDRYQAARMIDLNCKAAVSWPWTSWRRGIGSWRLSLPPPSCLFRGSMSMLQARPSSTPTREPCARNWSRDTLQ